MVPGMVFMAQALPGAGQFEIDYRPRGAQRASQELRLLRFQELLDDKARDGIDQRRDDAGALVDRAAKQTVEFLVNEHDGGSLLIGLSLLKTADAARTPPW
jgi:hypothetical protein